MGSCFGAVFSLSVLLPALGFIISAILKLIFCIIIVGVVFRCKSLRQFIRCSAIFIAVNTSFAGMVLLLQNTALETVLLYHNANLYCNINLTVLLVICAVCYVTLRFIFYILQKSEKSQIYSVQIMIQEQSVVCNAIIDTGNSLSDPISGRDVCVISYSAIAPLLPIENNAFFKGELSAADYLQDSWKKRVCIIPANFAVGESVLPAVRADKVIIADGKTKRILKNSIIAVTMNSFENMHYKMLLHPGLTDDMNLCSEEKENEIKVT